jgi:hypothetical protein
MGLANMEEEDYLKGYEDGLKEAWNEVIRLISRGAKAREVQMVIKSKIATIYQSLDAKKHKLKRLIEDDIQSDIHNAEGGPQKQGKPEPDVPEAPKSDAESESDSDIISKGALLINEEEPKLSFEIMSRMVKQGRKGMCVLRSYPDDVQEQFGLRSATMLWLTKTETVPPMMTPASLALGMGDMGELPPLEFDRTSPTNLQDLSSKVVGFMKSNQGSVVLLERVDYLISQNEFERVLKFIQFVRDKALMNGVALLLSINPKTINEIEYNRLKSEVKKVL